MGARATRTVSLTEAAGGHAGTHRGTVMKNSVERRSEVFVSATSRDLGAVREMAAKGLMTIGCHPVAQDTFPPDYRQVEDMLRDKIAACDAVVHIVGMRYGEEPPPGSLPEGTPRRSYTQMEADLARQLDKKLYVFVCPEDFPYDAAHAEEPETEDKQALQRAYREQLLTENTHLRTDVRDAADLGQRIRELDVELARLRGAVGRDRRRFVQVMALLAVVLVALAGGVWWSIAGRPTKEEIAAEVYKANPDLIKEQMRRTIRDSAEAKIKQFKDDGKGWQDIQQVEKERDLQLDEVDRMVERIVEGAKNAHPMYTRALEILEKEGPDALLAYLAARRTPLRALLKSRKSERSWWRKGRRRNCISSFGSACSKHPIWKRNCAMTMPLRHTARFWTPILTGLNPIRTSLGC